MKEHEETELRAVSRANAEHSWAIDQARKRRRAAEEAGDRDAYLKASEDLSVATRLFGETFWRLNELEFKARRT